MSCHVTLRVVMYCVCVCLDAVKCMLARVCVVGVQLYACLRLRAYICVTTRTVGVFFYSPVDQTSQLLIGRFLLAVVGVVCHGG